MNVLREMIGVAYREHGRNKQTDKRMWKDISSYIDPDPNLKTIADWIKKLSQRENSAK